MGTFFFPRSSKNSKKTGKEGSSATEKETNLQPKSKPPTKPFYQRTVEGLGWSLRPFPPPPLSWPSLQAFKIVSHNFLISHLLTPKSQPINGAVFRSFVLCFPKKKRKTLVGLVPRVQKKAIPTTCMVYMGPTQWTNLFLFVCFFRPGQFRTASGTAMIHENGNKMKIFDSELFSRRFFPGPLRWISAGKFPLHIPSTVLCALSILSVFSQSYCLMLSLTRPSRVCQRDLHGPAKIDQLFLIFNLISFF